MNYLKKILFALPLFGALLGSAQDLSKHKWENRLILLITDDENNSTFKSQIVEFRKDLTGLNERKLIIYQVMPGEYKTGLNGETKIKSSRLYKDYKKSDAGFEVVLLGLDGGVKLQQNELLSLEKLYATIDAMPMRRREIERK
ncbi:MAG: DUF4174 domain-containing protein [Bacteroidetes bacterium]|nr:MAG: DUF4174 domain-containing protein [Bacteroidota bacterium]